MKIQRRQFKMLRLNTTKRNYILSFFVPISLLMVLYLWGAIPDWR